METNLNFNQCTLPLLDKTFGLRKVASSSVLEDWLQRAAAVELSSFEEQYCLTLQNLLRANTNSWQEQELAMHFIGPLFTVVNFTS